MHQNVNLRALHEKTLMENLRRGLNGSAHMHFVYSIFKVFIQHVLQVRKHEKLKIYNGNTFMWHAQIKFTTHLHRPFLTKFM